jgi:hypothetical protein
MIRTIENIETWIGNARMMQVVNRINKPVIITGFLPILSDNDPVIGENIVYTRFKIR